MKNQNATDDICHELWLIYCHLKDVEIDPAQQLDLLQRSREQLGLVLNKVNRMGYLNVKSAPKSSYCQAANLNCRDQQEGSAPGNHCR